MTKNVWAKPPSHIHLEVHSLESMPSVAQLVLREETIHTVNPKCRRIARSHCVRKCSFLEPIFPMFSFRTGINGSTVPSAVPKNDLLYLNLVLT